MSDGGTEYIVVAAVSETQALELVRSSGVVDQVVGLRPLEDLVAEQYEGMARLATMICFDE